MFLFILSFLIRRLAQGALIVFLVTFVIFALLRVIPGDPTRVILGPMASEEVRENAAIELGLNKPIPVQYLSYVKDLSKGDFGKSFIRGKQGGSMGGSQDSKGLDLEHRASVLELILKVLPKTLIFAGIGIFFALFISVPIGILAGLKSESFFGKLSLYLSSFLVSLPNIWIALVLILVVSVNAGLLPAFGYKNITYAFLPAIVLAIEICPVLIRAFSVSVTSNLSETFYEIGIVRGISKFNMIFKHIIRNSLIPILNLFGAQLIGMVLGGLFVVEFIFNYPGLGLLAINAVFQRDFPIIQAIAVLASSALVIINIVVDLTASIIDRRLKF